ncbi:MAG: tetratricopeptide repeat protein [Aureispira sp.]
MKHLYLLLFLFPLTLLAQEEVLYYNKGVKAHNTGDYPTAITAYKKCLEINPKNEQAKQNLGAVYYNQALAAFNKNDFDAAIKQTYEAVRHIPKKPDVYALMGNAHIQQKQYKQALLDFTKAIEVSPNPADYYAARSGVHHSLLDNKNRYKDMAKAAQLAPNNAKYQFLTGKYKQAVDQELFKTALDNYNKAIELKPDYLEAITERATYYMTFGDFKSALKDLRKAERLGGDVKHLVEAAQFELEMQEGN